MIRDPFAFAAMADEARLDEAVRAFRRDNPMRWPCACIGCALTIKANYRAVLQEAEGAS